MKTANATPIDALLVSLADRECTSTQRLLALAIIGLAGADGAAIPLPKLAARTGFEVQTIRATTRSLEKSGVIQIVRHTGRSRPHFYKMNQINAPKNEN